MKKLLATLMTLLLLCTMIPVAAVSAAGEPTIVVSTVEVANAGDEIQVAVQLLNNPGVISAVVRIDFDPNVMELVTDWVYDEDLDEDVESNMIEMAKGWSTKYTMYGPLGTCSVAFINGTASKDVTKEDFFTATFKIKDDAVSGTYPLTVVYDPENFVNFASETVIFGSQDTTITINGSEPSCQHEYTYVCDKTCALCGELTNEAAEHSIVAVEAKAATCSTNGNIAYWQCEYCGYAWADEALTQQTNQKSVIIPATGEHVYDDDADADCNECGAIREVVTVIAGDVDGNGKVNNRDLGRLQQYINGKGVQVDVSAADMDGNGKINNRDLGLLQKKLNGQK